MPTARGLAWSFRATGAAGRNGEAGPEPEEERRRGEVAERVEQDRDRRGQDADQDAGEPRPEDPRRRAADLEPRVALLELVAGHELGDDRLVSDVEEDRQR